MAFLYQSKWQDVGYPLWVIPYIIWVPREVTNFVGVGYSCIAVDTYVLSIRAISDIWQIFYIDEGIACWLIVYKTTIWINSGFYCSSQYGISNTHYVGVAFVVQKHSFGFISDGFHIKYFLWWGLKNRESKIWDIIPFIGGDVRHETTWCILSIHQYFLFSSSIRGIEPRFSLIRFSEWFFTLFEFCLCIAFTVPYMIAFFSTTIVGDLVNISLRLLFLIFCFTIIIPIFPTMYENKLVADTLILVSPIRVITVLEI